MADQGLSLTLGELRREVARFLQFGREYEFLGDGQKADVDSCIRRGLRQFLTPPPTQGQNESHTWTWLRPLGSFATAASKASYDMPGNFGGIVGDMTYQSATDGAFRPVEVTSISALRARKQAETLSNGRPEIVALTPKSLSSGEPEIPTLFEATFYPTPDKAYTIEFQYIAAMEDFTSRDDSFSLPGGQAHGETIIASCLAVGEALTTDRPGRYQALFMQRLASSVSADRRLYLPSNLGQNLDRSDGVFRPRRTSSQVTYTP